MKINEVMLNEDIDFRELAILINKVKTLTYNPVNEKIWSFIQREGISDDLDNNNSNDWEYTILPISDEDRKNIVDMDDETLDKFELYSGYLKEKYNYKYADIIDYNDGIIYIVKLKEIQKPQEEPKVEPEPSKEKPELSKEIKNDALSGLVNLGYKKDQAIDFMNKTDLSSAKTAEDVIKLTLRTIAQSQKK